jgi:hypothetical protein
MEYFKDSELIIQDNILLIMNCVKYKPKALFQKKTWLRNIPDNLLYFHVIGNPNILEYYKFNLQENLLIVRTKDDYNSLPKKVIAAFEAINDRYKFKYIYKTDDDQILVKTHFFNILPTLIAKKNSHYGGYKVNVPQPYLSQYSKIHPELPTYLPILATVYCSGRFYFLSKEAVSDLLSKKENIEKELLEDYAIGFNLDKKYKVDLLGILTNTFFTDIELSDFDQSLIN